MTATTILATRVPMSLKAIDAWSGDGFNENYAFNQTVGLLGRTGAGTKASMRGRRPAGAYLLLGRGPIHQSGIVRLHYGNADPMEPAAGVRRLGDRRAGRCVCRDAEEEVNREPVYTSF